MLRRLGKMPPSDEGVVAPCKAHVDRADCIEGQQPSGVKAIS